MITSIIQFSPIHINSGVQICKGGLSLIESSDSVDIILLIFLLAVEKTEQEKDIETEEQINVDNSLGNFM